MRGRARVAFLSFAGLIAIAPFSAVAAMPLGSGPARPATIVGQPLTWSIVASPNRIAAGNHHANLLEGISCPSAGDCTTVGYSLHRDAGRTLVETWNGTTWSIVPSPNRGFGDQLSDVSCASASACMAVGTSSGRNSNQTKTLTEYWNGTTWSIVPSPNPGRTEAAHPLISVSCVSASDCMAVGAYVMKDGTSVPLTTTWDGTTWSVTPSPHRGSASSLRSISCPASDACTAVGHYQSSTSQGVLAESWNGSKWSLVPTPSASVTGSLDAISCTAANSCMAVGKGDDSTLAETWNGSTWTVEPTANPGISDDPQYLGNVSCATASDCVAVGSYYGDVVGSEINEETLVEAWNGTAWSLVSSPNQGRTDVLIGVSCASSATCMADGYHGGIAKTLTELGS